MKLTRAFAIAITLCAALFLSGIVSAPSVLALRGELRVSNGAVAITKAAFKNAHAQLCAVCVEEAIMEADFEVANCEWCGASPSTADWFWHLVACQYLVNHCNQCIASAPDYICNHPLAN